ncbi:MAG: SelB C-terminal domain-containing protein [Nitrosomonadales bacterium]|nr:SelB C-terminal domain-containing protein [Nitrosomonadales bacterium]
MKQLAIRLRWLMTPPSRWLCSSPAAGCGVGAQSDHFISCSTSIFDWHNVVPSSPPAPLPRAGEGSKSRGLFGLNRFLGDNGFVRCVFRDRIGTGRKLAIQILEFFDASAVTRRAGDAHYLR